MFDKNVQEKPLQGLKVGYQWTLTKAGYTYELHTYRLDKPNLKGEEIMVI